MGGYLYSRGLDRTFPPIVELVEIPGLPRIQPSKVDIEVLINNLSRERAGTEMPTRHVHISILNFYCLDFLHPQAICTETRKERKLFHILYIIPPHLPFPPPLTTPPPSSPSPHRTSQPPPHSSSPIPNSLNQNSSYYSPLTSLINQNHNPPLPPASIQKEQTIIPASVQSPRDA